MRLIHSRPSVIVAIGTFWASSALLGCEDPSSAWTEEQGVVHTERRVGIGTSSPQAELEVKGTILAEEVKVAVDAWPDYVFAPDYPLMPLEALAERLRTDRHLPGIPDAETAARDGVKLGEVQRKLLEKVEELTLYVLELERANKQLARRIDEIEKHAVGEAL